MGLIVVFFLTYIAMASYIALSLPSFLSLIPFFIGIILIPLQALLFDWFDTKGRSLSLNENEVIYRNRPNMLYSDTDEVEVYSLNDKTETKVYFLNLSCLQCIKIEFIHNKKLYISGFFINPEDFKKIKEHLRIL